MADVAQLGLAVDSSQVKKGSSDLDKLSASAAKAEAAANGLSGATKNVGAAASAAAKGISSETAATNAATKAVNAHKAAVNANNAAMVATTAAAKGNGMQVRMVAQQLSQVAQQTQATGNFMAALAIQMADIGMIFGTAGIAIGVVVGVILQLVNGNKLLSEALYGLASILPTIAEYAAIAAAGLALIYAPAAISGIVQMIALMGRLAVSAIGLAAAFAAANPATAFVLGITAAVAAANIFRDELTQIFGFDIVGAAKTAINAIIGAFVGGFNGIKAVWSQLPAAIGDLVISTANAVITGVENMINKVSTAINGFIQKINGLMQSLPFGVGEGVSIGTIGPTSLGRVANPYAGAANSVQDAVGGAMSAAMGTDYLGNFGTAIANGASAAAGKLKELAAGLAEVDDAAKKTGSKASDPWKGLRNATDKTIEKINEAKQSLGESFGGILDGLLNKTMTWKDALLSAMRSILKYFDTINTAQGGTGLFGNGIVGGILKGVLGFANGGFTGSAAASKAVGVVHGGEYVFSKRATDRIGVGNLDAMHRSAKGYASGGYVAPSMPANNNRAAPSGNQIVNITPPSGYEAETKQYRRGNDQFLDVVIKRTGDAYGLKRPVTQT